MEEKKPLIAGSLKENQRHITKVLKGAPDLRFRELTIGSLQGLLVYLDGLADREYISSSIIRPLLDLATQLKDDLKVSSDFLQREVLNNTQIQSVNNYEDIFQGLIAGQTILILEESEEALIFETFGAESRSIQLPETEDNIRGPREGFVERIEVNVSMLRRKIKDTNLCFDPMNLGQRTRTTIYVAYIDGIVNPKLVQEVKRRIQTVDIDAILESGYIEQLIEDAPQSIFPTVGSTEKPDKLAAKLLEGRVGILVDGTPFVLTVPYLFVEAFQNSEDYYARPYYATAIRLVRYLSFYISTMLPAFYVAIQSFHQEMVPTNLLIHMSAGREGIPFPVIVEALGMGIIYEILREAGVRMPTTVGQAVSIVGALVIGEAAVSAGLVGQLMVIVLALTAISGFLVPPLVGPASLLRLYFLITTAFLGMFGWLLSLMALLIHMMALRSFGIPYLSPIIPNNIGDFKDGMIRAPLWAMLSRPSLLSDKHRQGKENWRNALRKIKQNN